MIRFLDFTILIIKAIKGYDHKNPPVAPNIMDIPPLKPEKTGRPTQPKSR